MKSIGIVTNKDVVGEIKEGAQLVAESIRRLMLTRPYERPRSPVGSNVHQVLFEPNDFTAATLIAYYVNEAIEKYEPRVEIDSIVATNQGNNTVRIDITFRLKEDQTQTFLVSTTVGGNLG